MNTFIRIVREIRTIAFVVFLFVFFPLVAVPCFILSMFLFRPVVGCLQKAFRPDLDSFVANEHALYTMRDGETPINVIQAAIFQADMTAEEQRELTQARLLDIRNAHGDLLYHGLKRTWTNFLGYAFWTEEKDFDLSRHIRLYDYHGGDLGLPNPCVDRDLHRILGGLLDNPWNRAWSPWETLIIRGFGEERNKSVLIIRFDHVLADGYSLMACMKMLVQSPFYTPQMNLATKGSGTPRGFWGNLGLVFRIPRDTFDNLRLIIGAGKLQHFYWKDVEQGRSSRVIVSVSSGVNVQVIKDIKNSFGVYYAAVLYAAILGAIARALEDSGQEVPERLASAFVLPKPNHPGGLCVHAFAVAAQWPLKSSSSLKRLMEIQKNFESLSHSTASLYYMTLAKLGAYYPIAWRQFMFRFCLSLGISLGSTNFPVTVSPDYYVGHEILDLIPGVGVWPSVGIVVTTGGVNNNQKFHFSVTKSVFSSPEIARNLGVYVDQELQALAAAAVSVCNNTNNLFY